MSDKNKNLSLEEVRAKRNRSILKISESLKNSMEEKEYENESKRLEEEMYTNFGIKNYFSNKSSVQKKLREEKKEMDNKAYLYLTEELFFSIFYNSLQLDESYKESFKEILRDKSDKFINSLCENISLNTNNEFTDRVVKMKPIGDLVVNKRIENESGEINLDSEELELINKAEKDNIEFINESSKVIKLKVLEVIAEEKHISMNREKILRENKKFSGKTLFNGLNNKNYKELISEDIDTNGILMEESFAESIIDYTLLETVSTLKLLNLDSNTVNRITNRLYK